MLYSNQKRIIKFTTHRPTIMTTNSPSPYHVILQNLMKSYESSSTPALYDVNAQFERGKIHSIIGRSGAGKTTLLRCLNGLESPDSGSILIDNQDLTDLKNPQRRRILQTIGTVFQKFNLLSRRTVLENALLPLEWLGIKHSQAHLKALDLLEKVGLKGLEHRYPAQLSGGQCQRVAIARALVTDTRLLLCDEFTSALDPETSLEVLNLLWHLNQTMGVTVILITHDMSVVREVSDFVYVMERGKIVESGSFQSILLHPSHPTTKSLLRGELMKDLPASIADQLQPISQAETDQLLLQLIFFGEATQRPVIADLIQSHQIAVNILAGGLNHVRGMTFGALLVSIPQGKDQRLKALKHFEENDVIVESLGYLPKTFRLDTI